MNIIKQCRHVSNIKYYIWMYKHITRQIIPKCLWIKIIIYIMEGLDVKTLVTAFKETDIIIRLQTSDIFSTIYLFPQSGTVVMRPIALNRFIVTDDKLLLETGTFDLNKISQIKLLLFEDFTISDTYYGNIDGCGMGLTVSTSYISKKPDMSQYISYKKGTIMYYDQFIIEQNIYQIKYIYNGQHVKINNKWYPDI